jgi:hypothetical protein
MRLPYTDHVRICAQLAFLLCLPACLAAQTSVYTIHLESPVASSAIRSYLTYEDSGWDVSVIYDAGQCAIFCSYRRVRDVSLLLPPITVIEVDMRSGAKPVVFLVDPAGIHLPAVESTAPPAREKASLPTRKSGIVRTATCEPHPAQRTTPATTAGYSVVTHSALAPLRI